MGLGRNAGVWRSAGILHDAAETGDLKRPGACPAFSGGKNMRSDACILMWLSCYESLYVDISTEMFVYSDLVTPFLSLLRTIVSAGITMVGIPMYPMMDVPC